MSEKLLYTLCKQLQMMIFAKTLQLHLNLYSYSLGLVEGYLFLPATIKSSFLELLSISPMPTLAIFPLSPEMFADCGLP